MSALADLHRTLPVDVDTPHRLSGSEDAFSIPVGSTTTGAGSFEPHVPEQWGHLRVLEPLGRGAFGVVYRAWDTRLDREVALKLLPIDARGAAKSSAIIEEGRLLARVRHPHVVTIYGADRLGDWTGLWMELVRGRTLEQAVRTARRFSADETVRIGLEVCRAVLMDFGTGREVAAQESGGSAGTPLYLAPEVLSGAEATVRSDVYSLGVLLFHLVTGAYPVPARNLDELRAAHARREQLSVGSRHPNLPPRLARAIARRSIRIRTGGSKPRRRWPRPWRNSRPGGAGGGGSAPSQ